MVNPTDGVAVRLERASIATATVSVRMIQIDKRKMTLALFRQLPEIKLCGGDGRANEEFSWWGRVNYQPQRDGPSMWMIGVLQGELCRASVSSYRYERVETKIARYELMRCENLTRRGALDDPDDLALAREEYEELFLRDSNLDPVLDAACEMPQLFIAI